MPGDVEVAVNGWVLHRDKEVFGVDADEYRPERWLEGKAKEMERHMYQVSPTLLISVGYVVQRLPCSTLSIPQSFSPKFPASILSSTFHNADLSPHSSAAEPICALAATWLCSRSTSCFRSCFGGIGSNLFTLGEG